MDGINKLYNSNVYVDGDSYLGKASEVTLPEINIKTIEHDGLGMLGTPETFAGLEKMEATIKFNSFYPEVQKKVSNPLKSYIYQIRANLEKNTSAGVVANIPVIVILNMRMKSDKGDSWKKGESAGKEYGFAVNAYKLTIDGEVIHDIDIFSETYIVNGVDIMAEAKKNLGI